MNVPAAAARIHFIVVDEATGRIKRSGSTSDRDSVMLQARGERGEVAMVTDAKIDTAEFYVVDGTLRPRPVVILPAEIETEVGAAVAIGAPRGSRVVRDGIAIGTADDVLSFVPEKAGTTHLKIRPPFPYQPSTVRVVAGRAALERRRQDREDAAARGFGGVRRG